MRVVSILACLVVLAAQSCLAHLCNDVFAQAKDNLAVKVDVRDGQLRINKEGSFRVYLLNTMDRDIANINLEIESPDFDSVVTPAPEWKGFPVLRTAVRGGKKEYFDVALTRKSGTADGKYSIGLRLFNGRNPSMVFKTVDINDAAAIVPIPLRASSLKVDGVAQKEEWAEALLCSSFSEYHKKGNYQENVPSEFQTRVRFSHDKDSLYALLTCPDAGEQDRIKIFLAADQSTAPRVITVDLKTAQVADAEAMPGIVCKRSEEAGGIELSLPLASAGLSGAKAFFANLARERDGRTLAWRGNSASVGDPVSFASFRLNE